jgi:hypothetical protein
VLAGGNTQRLIRDFTQGQGDEILLLARLSALMVAALRAPLPGPGDLTAFGDIIRLSDTPPQSLAAQEELAPAAGVVSLPT